MEKPRRRFDAGAPAPGTTAVMITVIIAIVLVVAATALTVVDRVKTDAGTGTASPTTTAVSDDQDLDDAAAFLADWRRWRTLSVTASGTFMRIAPDGERLESPTMVVQDGERRLTSSLGGVSGHDGLDDITCVTESDGTARCDRTTGTRSPEQRLADELDRWATYFSGEPPYYRVGVVDGCHELVLTRVNPAADFGSMARFCFDEVGALIETRIEYSNGLVETTELTDVQVGPVADAAFEQILESPEG